MKVLFGSATISGKISVDTVVSLEATYKLLDKEGIEHDIIYISGKSPVATARGDIVGLFHKLDHTDLFLVDDDVGFPAEAVLRILNRPEKVVGGTYPIKDDKAWHYAGIPMMEDGIPIGRDGLMEADSVAGGFLRMKRVVIDKMIEAYPELEYKEYGRTSYNLFGTYISDNYLWGDDYAFCNRWKKIGGQLWIDPDIDFKHIGIKTWKGNYHKYLLALKVLQDADKTESGINGWMTDRELELLRHLATTSKSIVEVGSWKGRSTKELLEACEGTVYAVDHFRGSTGDTTEYIADITDVHEEFMSNVGHYKNLSVLTGDSLEIANSFNGTKVEMVFIDAGHTYDECKADIEAWMPKCTKIISGHDYGDDWPGVKKAVDEKFNKVNVVDSIWWVDLREAV